MQKESLEQYPLLDYQVFWKHRGLAVHLHISPVSSGCIRIFKQRGIAGASLLVKDVQLHHGAADAADATGAGILLFTSLHTYEGVPGALVLEW